MSSFFQEPTTAAKNAAIVWETTAGVDFLQLVLAGGDERLIQSNVIKNPIAHIDSLGGFTFGVGGTGCGQLTWIPIALQESSFTDSQFGVSAPDSATLVVSATKTGDAPNVGIDLIVGPFGSNVVWQIQANGDESGNDDFSVGDLDNVSGQSLIISRGNNGGNVWLNPNRGSTSIGNARTVTPAAELDVNGALVLRAAAASAPASTVSFGSTVQTTVGAEGSASALPALPSGYLIINVAGTEFVLPYYKQS